MSEVLKHNLRFVCLGEARALVWEAGQLPATVHSLIRVLPQSGSSLATGAAGSSDSLPSWADLRLLTYRRPMHGNWACMCIPLLAVHHRSPLGSAVPAARSGPHAALIAR